MRERRFRELRQALRVQGITQARLAGKIGISEKSMSCKMTGRNEFTRREMLIICKLLNSTLDSLFGERQILARGTCRERCL
jgi:DNA-binding XRE family transcriptional regulator